MKPVNIPPFPLNIEKQGRCCKCHERDILNCFNRCEDCEIAYQKDVLLETVESVNLDALDNDSLRLIANEFRIRAAELLARGK
jgi:hypothetical protein